MTNPQDHLMAAANPDTDPAALESLLPATVESRHSQEIALALAANPASPPELLTTLLGMLTPIIIDGGDDHGAISAALAVCCNTEVPFAAIETFLSEPDAPRDFRKIVARETPRTDVLELLADDRSGKVRKWALTRLAEMR